MQKHHLQVQKSRPPTRSGSSVYLCTCMSASILCVWVFFINSLHFQKTIFIIYLSIYLPPDLYVKLYVVNVATQKRIIKKKTRVCRHDREPSFNETFRFPLNPTGHAIQVQQAPKLWIWLCLTVKHDISYCSNSITFNLFLASFLVLNYTISPNDHRR